MSNSSKMIKRLWPFLGFGLVALAAYFFLFSASDSSQLPSEGKGPQSTSSAEGRQGTGRRAIGLEAQANPTTSTAAVPGQDTSAPPPGMLPVPTDFRDQPELAILQAHLDENDEEQILAQAEYLMKTSTVPAVRVRAIEALRWVDRSRAAAVLTPVLSDGDTEVARAALDVYSSILEGFGETLEYDEGMNELTLADIDVEEYTELWKTAIWNAGSVYDRDKLLIKLSSLTELFSIPIVLDMQESEMPELQSSGTEYLDFITYGTGVSNRAEAQDWLNRNGPSINVVAGLDTGEATAPAGAAETDGQSSTASSNPSLIDPALLEE